MKEIERESGILIDILNEKSERARTEIEWAIYQNDPFATTRWVIAKMLIEEIRNEYFDRIEKAYTSSSR